MKALQLTRPRSFTPVDVARPELGSAPGSRLVVETGSVSICGSDIPSFTGRRQPQAFPLPAGAPIHECAGTVVQTTSTRFCPGDLVVAIPDFNQGLAEYFTALASRAVKLPADLAGASSCPLVQPLSTVVSAVDRVGAVAGRTFAVVGLGSIGLLFCWLLRRRGASAVVGIDPLESRCRLAERIGATRTRALRSAEVLRAAREDASTWEPPDVCVEAVGHQMETLNDCLGLVGRRGTVLAFGVPDHDVYSIEFSTFFRKNAQLLAAVTPDWTEYLPKALALFAEHRHELEALVTHRLPIRDAGRAFELYERHEEGIVKVLLDGSAWK
ncbi:MAG TPA: zinc-binding dehydrogenase [Myxococcaceae bacterium]|nr:zinc-binding dehydrogenase [Myxococcaceae bacterium]